MITKKKIEDCQRRTCPALVTLHFQMVLLIKENNSQSYYKIHAKIKELCPDKYGRTDAHTYIKVTL